MEDTGDDGGTAPEELIYRIIHSGLDTEVIDELLRQFFVLYPDYPLWADDNLADIDKFIAGCSRNAVIADAVADEPGWPSWPTVRDKVLAPYAIVGIYAAETDASSLDLGKPEDTPIEWPGNYGFVGSPTRVTLEPGTTIQRWGSPTGRFACPEGTLPRAVSWPPGAESGPLSTYKVVKSLEVHAGPAAPWFGQPGGGTQYMFGTSIQNLVDSGCLVPLP